MVNEAWHSAFIAPDLREKILDINKVKLVMPELDEQEKERLNDIIIKAFETKEELRLIVWRGEPVELKGVISLLKGRKITLEMIGNKQTIAIESILNAY